MHDEAGNLRGFSKITRDLTERRQAEENARRLLEEQAARQAAEEAERQVRASEERLRLFVEHTPAAVAMLDRDMHYLLVSQRRLREFGLEGQNVIGRSYYEVFPNVPERWKEVHRRCLAGAVERCEEDRFIRPDGQEVWLRWEICPWRDPQGEIGGVMVFSEVITDRKRAQEALRQSEARNAAILDTALDCIITIDHEGKVVEFNPAAERTFGYRRADVLGREMAELIVPSPLRERHRRGLAHYLATGEGPVLDKRLEMPALRADGTEFPVELAITRISAEGPPLFTAYLRDITERKRAEQATRFLADASTSLAALVDDGSTMQKVARLAVPSFADWCAVDVVEPDGSLRRVAVAHADPSKVELAHELNRRYPPDPDAPQGVPHILRTGKPELISEITDALLVETVKDEELLRIMRELGLKSYLGVPLRARGRTVGAITFVAAESGRRFDATDLAVAEDLAHRAGIAMENARLIQRSAGGRPPQGRVPGDAGPRTPQPAGPHPQRPAHHEAGRCGRRRARGECGR